MTVLAGKIVPIKEKFTAYKYLNILQNLMIPSVRTVYRKPEIIYLVKEKNSTIVVKREKSCYYYRFSCIIS